VTYQDHVTPGGRHCLAGSSFSRCVSLKMVKWLRLLDYHVSQSLCSPEHQQSRSPFRWVHIISLIYFLLLHGQLYPCFRSWYWSKQYSKTVICSAWINNLRVAQRAHLFFAWLFQRLNFFVLYDLERSIDHENNRQNKRACMGEVFLFLCLDLHS
jgi:hypothetical protein